VHGLRPRDLAGVIGLAGPYDFLPLTEPGIMQALGPSGGWKDTQPINFVDGDEPSFLLLQGDSDKRVDPGNSPRFATRLRASGVPVSLVVVPGVGHIGLVNGFYSSHWSPALEDSMKWIESRAR
jgi:acetyl esterase/lipase